MKRLFLSVMFVFVAINAAENNSSKFKMLYIKRALSSQSIQNTDYKEATDAKLIEVVTKESFTNHSDHSDHSENISFTRDAIWLAILRTAVRK